VRAFLIHDFASGEISYKAKRHCYDAMPLYILLIHQITGVGKMQCTLSVFILPNNQYFPVFLILFQTSFLKNLHAHYRCLLRK
jgi:hypothetical protein